MLRFPGTNGLPPNNADRRALLQTGALGLCGLASAGGSQASLAAPISSTAEYPGFGRAKRCLLLYIYGAWSQLDTFDPKPQAPADRLVPARRAGLRTSAENRSRARSMHAGAVDGASLEYPFGLVHADG